MHSLGDLFWDIEPVWMIAKDGIQGDLGGFGRVAETVDEGLGGYNMGAAGHVVDEEAVVLRQPSVGVERFRHNCDLVGGDGAARHVAPAEVV